MIKKVISGGQIGADIAGLQAAKACDIQTGGWMPKGFKTLEGNRPDYKELYGLIETPSDDYPTRTALNVQSAGCTLRFAIDFNKPGERRTLHEIRRYGKSYEDIPITFFEGGGLCCTRQPRELVPFLARFETVNIAGNAIRAIEPVVFGFLVTLFDLTNGSGDALSRSEV